MIAIAMTTAPRRVPTVHRALASLRGAGFREDVQLFAEPGTFGPHLQRPADTQTRVLQNVTTRGCFGNWKYALRCLMARAPKGWIMIVQDDATWLPGAADVLRAEIQKRHSQRTGFLSPYVIKKDVPAGSGDGWRESSAGWNLWGALALCMQASTAAELLRHPRFVKHPSNQQIDAVVAASMLDLRRPSFVHVPSLVDHVGETSTLGHENSATLRGYRFGAK